MTQASNDSKLRMAMNRSGALAVLERFGALLKDKKGSRNSTWILLVFFAGLVALIWDLKEQPVRQPNEAVPYELAATSIPAGYVLVPIEVANYESLDSILGQFGVVDLYVPSLDSRTPPRKVAERIKILRAPLNPSHFAVLAPEDKSASLVTHEGSFVVAVQNPNTDSGMKFVNSGQGNEDGRGAAPAPSDPPQAKRNKRPSRITVEVNDVETFQ